MSSNPKVLFVYDHPQPEWWLDGLSAALDLLEDDFEIERLNLRYPKNEPLPNYDFVLAWGGFHSSAEEFVRKLPGKKGLCIGGNAIEPYDVDEWSVLFAETDWIINNYLPKHPNIVKAFGTNTDIYNKTDMPVSIVWDYIGVGSLSSWKRWEKMKDKKGNRLVVGEYQLGNEAESLSIARDLLKGGVMVSNTVNPLDLAMMYHYSRTLYLPCDVSGGGERAALEARSCGLSVLVEDDNPKLKELVECDIPSHFDYAKQLKKSLLSCL